MISRHSREVEQEKALHHTANVTSKETPHNTTATPTMGKRIEVPAQPPNTDMEDVPSQKPNANKGEASESQESSEHLPQTHADTAEPRIGVEVQAQGNNAAETDEYYPMALDVCATETLQARFCGVLTTSGRFRK